MRCLDDWCALQDLTIALGLDWYACRITASPLTSALFMPLTGLGPRVSYTTVMLPAGPL